MKRKILIILSIVIGAFILYIATHVIAYVFFGYDLDKVFYKKEYICPEGPHVGCMPMLSTEEEWYCSDEFINWAEKSCPNFVGPLY